MMCKGTCGRFYHRLCLQIDCACSDAKKEHICLACRNDASHVDGRKTDNNNMDASSKVNSRNGNSSRASTRQRKSAEVDQYFGTKPGKKSSKTDGPSDIIVPSQKECIAEVNTLIRQSNVEIEFDKYEIQYQQQFHEWSFALATSQSILLYGLGSKISILTSFGQHVAQEGDVMSLNGYDPNIDMNAFLDCIDNIFCDGNEYQRSITQPARDQNNWLTRRATTIAKRIATTRSRPLFLLIHNIDGVGLRNVFAQEALAILTANSNNKDGSPMIRIAASVDNVNASMVLWSPYVEHKFDWVSDMVMITIDSKENAWICLEQTPQHCHLLLLAYSGLEKGSHIQTIHRRIAIHASRRIIAQDQTRKREPKYKWRFRGAESPGLPGTQAHRGITSTRIASTIERVKPSLVWYIER